MYISTLMSLSTPILLVIISTLKTNHVNGDGLESFNEIDGALVRADRNLYAAYNKDSSYPECVWLFGGNNANDLYCFNINTYTITYWDQLSSTYTFKESSTSASVAISDGNGNDYLYILDVDGYLLKYDLNLKTLELLNSNLVDYVQGGCMVQNPINTDQLLIVGGGDTDNFLIYTISTNNKALAQPLNSNVKRPTCIAINNEYIDSEPYLYVLQGDSTIIQRIDLSVNSLYNENWHTLTTTLESYNSNCDSDNGALAGGGFLWNNLIYMVGGAAKNWGGEDYKCILTFNIQDHSVEYFGDFPIGISRYAMVLAGDEVVMAGGYTSDSVDIDSIFISNKLSDSPTSSPTKTVSETCDKYVSVDIDTYTWEGANDYCLLTYGTTLATITSDDDMNEAVEIIDNAILTGSKTKFFIGYNYNSVLDEWEWEDGTISDYVYNNNFIDMTSNAYCGQVYWQTDGEKYWQSVRCLKATSYFLCNNPECLSTE